MDCGPPGDWCTPASSRRNDTSKAMRALYMSYGVGVTLSPDREKICGTESVNLKA